MMNRFPSQKLSHSEILRILLTAQKLADKWPLDCGVWVSTAFGVLKFHARPGSNDQIGFASDYCCDILVMLW